MVNKKKVLIIGIDPHLIDFSSAEFAAFPGLTAEKVEAGIKGSLQQLNELGYSAELCWTDFGDTAMNVLQTHLKKESFDGVVIGAGIRVPGKNFLLFEKMINQIHEHAPKSRICFNTNPQDTIPAVQRWINN
ncbi:MAG: hypothetical protein V4506_16130 [Bacteroidota bacterium]